MSASRARLEGPVPGDPFVVAAGVASAAGYVREEWFLSGTASGYSLRGERGEDGCWEAEHAAHAPFATRIVVLRPQDPARFNGTTVVEWMNVSGGIDAAPDCLFLHRHLMREGSVWVGVSAQKAGIDGGGLVPGIPLKQANAERYGSLVHPGDAFAFGIYTEVGRALRTPGSGPLGTLETQRLIAIGESQSAGFLVTYVNAVDPIERCFDAFLIHGRPGSAPSIDGGFFRPAGETGDLSKLNEFMTEGYRIREDVRVPVLTFQSETDGARSSTMCSTPRSRTSCAGCATAYRLPRLRASRLRMRPGSYSCATLSASSAAASAHPGSKLRAPSSPGTLRAATASSSCSEGRSRSSHTRSRSSTRVDRRST